MITYNGILRRMTEEYTELSGIVPQKTSDIYIRLSVLAGEIYNTAVNMEWLKNQMFPATATGEYLDRHAAERGIVRREASHSVGSVLFSLEQVAAYDMVIPKGTMVATDSQEPLCFETVGETVVSAGTSSAYADIKAIDKGAKWNVAQNRIKLIVTSVAGDYKVTNPDPCYGGTDTEGDESLRERIISSYKNTSNGTNCAYYERIALGIPGVTSASVVPRGRGAGTVDVYIAGDASEETVQQVQSELSSLREVNVDVKVYKANSAVINLVLNLEVKEGYEFTEVKNKCIAAIKEYISSRGVGGNVLLTEAGECVYHIEGVKEYSFSSYTNSDTRCLKNQYPVAGTITVTEGIF